MTDSIRTVSTVPDTAVVDIACGCHSRAAFRGEAGDCAGAIRFTFPTVMFEPSGSLDHRLHRSRFMQQMAALYDEKAEEVRIAINNMDPSIIRPPLEKLGLAVIDTTAITKALAPEKETDNGQGFQEADDRTGAAAEG